VETWLVRIVINVCKRQLRSPWRLLRAPQESLDSLRMEGPEPPDDTLVRAIQALPPKYREVIILYYYQEWRAWEIAQRLHVPVSTVTVRLSRARGLLKERLKGWYYEQE
jgi:RNA polymerase sigma factor (sigma-70 family)